MSRERKWEKVEQMHKYLLHRDFRPQGSARLKRLEIAPQIIATAILVPGLVYNIYIYTSTCNTYPTTHLSLYIRKFSPLLIENKSNPLDSAMQVVCMQS